MEASLCALLVEVSGFWEPVSGPEAPFRLPATRAWPVPHEDDITPIAQWADLLLISSRLRLRPTVTKGQPLNSCLSQRKWRGVLVSEAGIQGPFRSPKYPEDYSLLTQKVVRAQKKKFCTQTELHVLQADLWNVTNQLKSPTVTPNTLEWFLMVCRRWASVAGGARW